MERRKKYLNYLFLDISDTTGTPKWTRVTKSVDFAVVYNATTETFDFISDETPTTEVQSYAPTIGQTQHAYIGEPIYDYILKKSMHLAKGTDAKIKAMIVRQEKATGGGQIASSYEANLTWDTDDIVAGTITYSIALSNPVHGTATLIAGVPTFAPTVEV